MKKIYLIIIIAISSLKVSGQCQITAFANQTTDTINICEGDMVTLYAIGDCHNYLFFNDFNNGFQGFGWIGWLQPLFSDPCAMPSPDSSCHAWSSNDNEPWITPDLDVSMGGSIEFQFRYALAGGSPPCNGPSEYNNGISVSYSNNGGNNWNVIEYYAPNGDVLTYIPTSTTPIVPSGTQTPFTVWTTHNVVIPPIAMTPSTRFKWGLANPNPSSNTGWGMDNPAISGPSQVPLAIWWLHGPTGLTPQPVSPLQDTTYTVYISNGTDTAESSVYIRVNPLPTADFDISPDTICVGDIVTFNYTGTAGPTATYAWNFGSGYVLSGSGHGPYEVFWQSSGSFYPQLTVEENNCVSNMLTDTVIVISCAGITDYQENKLKIFPNPAKDIINIISDVPDNNMHISISNLLGEILLEQQILNKTNGINISALPNGIYLLKIKSENDVFLEKLLKY